MGESRFGERLQLEQNVSDELMKAFVPALILQPLVENAIRHGIEPQRAPGLISIEAKKEGGRLHLIVRDNGRGLGPNSDNLERRASSGIGLENTQARLLGLYGKDQSFSITSAAPQGCRVEIQVPFHLEPVRVPASNELIA